MIVHRKKMREQISQRVQLLCCYGRESSRREPSEMDGQAREGWRVGRRANQLSRGARLAL